MVLPALVPVAAVAAVDPGGYAPFGSAKWLAVTVLVLAAAAVALARGAVVAERRTLWLWVALLGWVTLSALVGLDRWYALLGTPERHAGFLLWLLCALAFVVGQRAAVDGARPLAYGATMAAGVVGLYSVVELVWRAPVRTDAVSTRLGGPFGSAAFLGAACCLLGPPALGVVFDGGSSRRWRVGGAVAAAGCVVALAGSGTRGAWLAAVVVAVVVGLSRRGRDRGRFALGVAAALMVAVATIGVLAARRDGATPLSRATPAAARLDEWRVALRVIARRPVSGTGPEGYRVEFPRQVDAAYERAYGRAVIPDRAHDVVLDVAATIGLPGLALVLALAALVGRSVVRVVRRGDSLAVGLAAGVLAYAVQQAVLFPLAELEPTAWLAAGVVVAIDTAATGRATVSLGAALRRPLVVLAAGLAAVALAAGGLDLAADRALHRWARATDPVAGAVDARRAARLRPDQLRYRIAAARAAAGTGDPAGAARQLAAASSWSRREPALVVERAQLVGTAAAWRAALASDPRRASSWLQLGLAAAREGDLATARAAWTQAQDLAPRDPAPSLDLARLALDEGRAVDAVVALGAARRIAPADPRLEPLAAELAARSG